MPESLFYFTHMNKLKFDAYNDLLHTALTSRIAGTNRTFTHLIRNTKGEWYIVRENGEGRGPELNILSNHIAIPVGCFAHKLHDTGLGKSIPLVIKLEDYRPCKLTTMKFGDREIPKVIGGGNTHNFIEEILEQTYQWYIDCDVERPSNDITHAYDVESTREPVIHDTPVEAPEATEAQGDSAVDEEVEDPFGPLYERSPSQRLEQWKLSAERKDPIAQGGVGVEKSESKKEERFFEKAIRECKDPQKMEGPAYYSLKEFLFENGAESDVEVATMINLIRSFPREYNYIQRNSEGSWLIGMVGESSKITFYFNNESCVCKPLRTEARMLDVGTSKLLRATYA